MTLETIKKVDYIMSVPKESKEVVDAIEQLLLDIKAKKELSVIIAGALPKLVVAIDGYEHVPAELKSDGLDEVLAYAVHKVLGALL